LLLAALVAAPAAAVVPAQSLSAADFVAACTAAVTSPRPPALLTFVDTLLIRNKYQVKLFRLSGTPAPADLNISVQIQRGPDTDIEIPRITGICVGSKTQVVKNQGDIEFKTPGSGHIPIGFHLVDLKHTKWKQAPNDSVWMVEQPQPVPTGKPPKHPNRDDWPKCIGPTKNVAGPPGGNDVAFDMCRNPGGSGDYIFVYELHLDQTSPIDQATVEVTIDPQIINHPP
jgi:hypothetical protein